MRRMGRRLSPHRSTGFRRQYPRTGPALPSAHTRTKTRVTNWSFAYLTRATGKDGSFPLDVDETCFTLEFSPDGMALAYSGYSRGGIVDAATGRMLCHLPGQVQGYRYSPDGQTLVGMTSDRLRIWDASTGREFGDRPGHFGLGAEAVARGGRLLIAEDIGAFRVGLWDTQNGRLIRDLRSPGRNIDNLRVAFVPDGRTILATRRSGAFWHWDARTGLPTLPTWAWMRDEHGGPYHRVHPVPGRSGGWRRSSWSPTGMTTPAGSVGLCHGAAYPPVMRLDCPTP